MSATTLSPALDAPLQMDVAVRFRYTVHFTQGVFEADNPLLQDTAGKGARLLCVLDQGLLRHHPSLPVQIDVYCRAHGLSLAGPPIIVPGGEDSKNDPALLANLWESVNRHGVDRHAFVMAVGGGAVLDMAGYAAATAHRGVRLIRVPTTALAQNDSAVGVKNSVNAFGKKNFLGTFAPPWAVLNDFTFLDTLPDRDWRAGISEAIKVALIRDADFFERLEDLAPALAARDSAVMREIVVRCARLHGEHIAHGGDPFEQGSSRPLDFGHWAAHKLEQVTRYALRHGEAVAIGMALDAAYSRRAGLLSAEALRRVLGVLRAVGLDVYHPALAAHSDGPAHPDSILRGLAEFREHLGGRLTVLLLRDIGQGVDVHEMDADQVRASIDDLRRFQEESFDAPLLSAARANAAAVDR